MFVGSTTRCEVKQSSEDSDGSSKPKVVGRESSCQPKSNLACVDKCLVDASEMVIGLFSLAFDGSMPKDAGRNVPRRSFAPRSWMPLSPAVVKFVFGRGNFTTRLPNKDRLVYCVLVKRREGCRRPRACGQVQSRPRQSSPVQSSPVYLLRGQA